MTGRDRNDRRRGAHLTGFVFSGLLAFVVDAGLLLVLTHWAGMSPFLARVPSIALSMVAGWSSNRRLTFRVSGPPGLIEFMRYAMASGAGVAVNYAVFSALLLAWPGLRPVAALVVASGVAAGFSYAGYRWFAFRR